MSTYDYHCRECGYAFEEYQPITADALVICPNCGKHALKRVMGTGGGLIFKGSGFYQTDYKKKNSSSPPTSTGKKEKTSDTKTPEKKSDSTDTTSNPAPAKKD